VLSAEGVEQREQRLEQPALRGIVALSHLRHTGSGWGEPGDQCPELAPSGLGESSHYGILLPCQRAKRRYERRVGKLTLAELDAVAAYNARGWGGSPCTPFELGEQSRLADARLTSYEDYGRLAGRGIGQSGFEFRQLGPSPDHASACHSSGHDPSIAPGSDVRYLRRGSRQGSPLLDVG